MAIALIRIDAFAEMTMIIFYIAVRDLSFASLGTSMMNMHTKVLRFFIVQFYRLHN